MDANKKICLDEVSVRFLRLLKSERLKAGLSQSELGKLVGTKRSLISTYENESRIPTVGYFVKLAEVLGYDLSSSVNYKYYHGLIDFRRLNKWLSFFGFTIRELSHYVMYDEATVGKIFSGRYKVSLDCLSKILEIFEDEHSLLKFRNKLLRQKKPSRRDIWQWPF